MKDSNTSMEAQVLNGTPKHLYQGMFGGGRVADLEAGKGYMDGDWHGGFACLLWGLRSAGQQENQAR